METVEQEDENGCGVAAVAMLTGVTYSEARDVIYPNGRSKLTRTKDLHAALIKLGRKPLSERRIGFRFKTPDDLDVDALIFVKMGKKGKGNGHWIVWDNAARELRDPDEPRPYQVKGYLPVA
jgi:hypothetical protein